MFSSLGLPTEQHTLPYKMLKLQLKQSKPFLNVTQFTLHRFTKLLRGNKKGTRRILCLGYPLIKIKRKTTTTYLRSTFTLN